MPVHVSIHDVSPAFEPEIDLALEKCDAVGARPALLVVPSFHGQWPLLEHPAYCKKLVELQARGHEIYLHGFFHQSREAPPPGASRVAWLFAQNVASGGEAEFSDVTRDEARARLEDGERVLHEAGLTIDGFIPPAWSMPGWLLPILAERGYTFTEDHLRIYAPASHRARASVVLNWASRSPGRLFSTVAFCRVAKHARALFPARVAIHPADMRFSLLRREIDRTLAWARGDLVARGADLLRG